ncbi:IS3 family transposase [Thiorhodococcus mannitoliphagus]|uniref:IS3 family transposase n=1 Tax=Thiorhodococcus mannitoliphagus TaxID=329406 RepID=A0A6P1E8Q4_9GAMM|nr:IS3 family transposase [Thiorhodococcus mannitoliphagus]
MSVAEKRACVEPDHGELSIARQCELIGLGRASYYRGGGLATDSAENLHLMRLLDEEYTRHPFYGSRKLTAWLRREGYAVNRKRVQRLLRRMGLVSLAPGAHTSRPAPQHKVYPYRLRGLAIERPNQVWCTDITYVRLVGGFVYLTVMLDWYSRYVLSWELSVTLEEQFCVSALQRALERYGAPEICNSDQGAQYTGTTFTGVLEDAGVDISMDGRGRALDNIMVERLWRSVKYEEIYLKEYQSVAALIEALRAYFRFYNEERPHQSHDNATPGAVYRDEVASVASEAVPAPACG